jgi:predicted amidohydrolase YtcJ
LPILILSSLTHYDLSDPSSRLSMNQVKMYMDGLLHTRTAAILGKYADTDPELGIGDSGLNYFLQGRVSKYMKALQVCV